MPRRRLARHRLALTIAWGVVATAIAGLLATAGLLACSPRETDLVRLPPPRPTASFALDVPPLAPSAPPAPPAPPRVSRCKPLGPGQISDDEAPTLKGVGEPVSSIEWLEARGVTKGAALAWYAARRGGDTSSAEIAFGAAMCRPFEVGAPAEEAVVCLHATPASLMQVRALGIVVRGKRPVALFDLGLIVQAMDFPDARSLDLALSISAGGHFFELAERAPDGTQLVEAPSWCRHAEEERDRCAASASSSSDAGVDCALRAAVPGPSAMGYPATIHDCAGARRLLQESMKEQRAQPMLLAETRSALGFVEKSCRDVGRWVWKIDHYIRDPTL